ncbi:MAG: hypothetical protein RSF81_04865 [Oscillospiraceae bacterium]
MIIRDLPKNLLNYIAVNSEQSYILHSNGFFPEYMYGDKIYYKKTSELIDFVRKEDLVINGK